MLPAFLKSIFWSWDFSKLKKNVHKKTIIRQIMEFGSFRDVAWMFDNYSKEEILNILKNFRTGDLSKKSRNFWNIILN